MLDLTSIMIREVLSKLNNEIELDRLTRLIAKEKEKEFTSWFPPEDYLMIKNNKTPIIISTAHITTEQIPILKGDTYKKLKERAEKECMNSINYLNNEFERNVNAFYIIQRKIKEENLIIENELILKPIFKNIPGIVIRLYLYEIQ